jgi:hypothetical protein
MSGVEELIKERVDSICRFGYWRFRLSYKYAVRAMIVDAINLHGEEPARDVAEAILVVLRELQYRADSGDESRIKVLRLASKMTLIAYISVVAE